MVLSVRDDQVTGFVVGQPADLLPHASAQVGQAARNLNPDCSKGVNLSQSRERRTAEPCGCAFAAHQASAWPNLQHLFRYGLDALVYLLR
jgi:hypothetical protein